ncbi:MAG: AhpC/TSA family protein [Cyclobacteriaceae bacterium]
MKIINFQIVVFLLFLASEPVLAQKEAKPLKVGDEAFNFMGLDQNGEKVELFKVLEKSPVVLMFYRGAWCPYCNKQLSEMQDSLKFINERGGIVIAVTPEKPGSIDKTIKKTNASFKIIHDKDLDIMNTYKVRYSLDDAMVKKYKSYGIDILKANDKNGANLPVPATYIIDKEKKILYAFFDPDHTKRATVTKILQNL